MSMNEEIITVIPGVEYLTYEQMNILITYQKLWNHLSMWMRNFMFSNLEDSKNLASVTSQLFENLPLDFYNAFRVFYGPEISQRFLSGFSRFLASALQLINAYKHNDTAAIDSSTAQWYQSADELATFLATINVYWSENQWKNLLYQYIRLKIQEIITILNGDYENEIKIFNNIENLTDLMGSYMARGIIARSIGVRNSLFAKHFMSHD